MMMMIQSCGANFVNENGDAYIVGNDIAEKCVDIYTELVQNDVVKLVNNWDEYVSTITNGEAAGVVNGIWTANLEKELLLPKKESSEISQKVLPDFLKCAVQWEQFQVRKPLKLQ
jgi:ABC-type glycerol-3-phosphate transport system substrate-binding protein